MNDYDRAQRYLDKISPAGEGGRNDALNAAAFAIAERFELSETDFSALLSGWAARCSPPMNAIEAGKTIRSAWAGCSRKGAAGSKRSVRHTFEGTPQHSARPALIAPSPIPATGQAKIYDLSDPGELPSALDNPCRAFILAAFEPGEGISIAQEIIPEGGEKGIPKNGGVVLSREVWLEKLDVNDGNPNKLYSTSDRTGAFVRVNPMKDDGERDTDVTAFRHALLEFDKITVEQQWSLIQQSAVPCSCVIYSGNKSIHAWVRIDARDRAEYNARVSSLYDHFAGYIEKDSNGKEIDRVRANKNPSRFSRLPGMVRGENKQELWAVKTGCESFLAWQLKNNMDAFSRPVSIESLENFVPVNDANCLLGQRWLCKGGSCLFVGQSGIGKSSLNMQAALTWAVGRSFFGIAPARKLKSLIIQAENDDGDLSEMYQGVRDGLTGGAAEVYQSLRPDILTNCKWETVSDKSGPEFLSGLAVLIDKHKPDLCWLDPLLSFVGDDLSKQTVCSTFLRGGLNKISKQTGVAWMLIHHTGKPPQDKKNQKQWAATDFAYLGFGSSELVNWARAVCVLRDMGEATYNLKLAKRGDRAGAKNLDLAHTVDLTLEHSKTGIWWNQIADADEVKHSVKRPGAAKKFEVGQEFLESIKGVELSYTRMLDRIIEFEGCGKSTAKAHFKKMLANGSMVKDDVVETYRAKSPDDFVPDEPF